MGDSDIERLITQCKEITAKVDTLVVAQTSMSGKIDGMESQLTGTKEQVVELYRTVRGFNGTPGMVTTLTLLKDIFDKHVETEAQHNAEAVESRDKGKDSAGGSFITWQWVVDKLTVPLVVTVIVWLLMTFIPNVLNHLNSVPKP